VDASEDRIDVELKALDPAFAAVLAIDGGGNDDRIRLTTDGMSDRSSGVKRRASWCCRQCFLLIHSAPLCVS